MTVPGEFVAVSIPTGVVRALVVRSRRKTLGITVTPEGAVVVRAPESALPEQVAQRVNRRAGWIAGQLAEVASYDPRLAPHQWRGGESHRYLGRQYLLRIKSGEAAGAAISRPHLVVTVPKEADAEQVRRILLRWYRKRAEVVFSARWSRCVERAKAIGVASGDFGIRTMRRRWGSCSPSGKILLNLDLIQVPTECIDYVMLHELCHRARMRHDRTFVRLLDRLEPDWRRLKDRLNRCEIPVLPTDARSGR